MTRQHAIWMTAVFVLLAASAAPGAQQPPPVAPPAAQSQAQPQAGAQGQPAATPALPATAEALGVPFYPKMEFVGSFDAGSGQRYYLFGVDASFDDVVAWYKTALKQRGELVFDQPATQEFDIGKYREETMAFPPSVTVKDYTWNGMGGYPNPKSGAEPARFRTVVQVVPVPAAPPSIKREPGLD